jgi:hypothetical protein
VEGSSSGGTSMVSVTGDGNGEGEAMDPAIFGGQEGQEARHLLGAKSNVAAGEDEGDD